MSAIEEKKQELIRELLEAAQKAIVSKDPTTAMKGRYTRDCAVPIVHWLMDEYERIYGDAFLINTSEPKQPEQLRAEADLIMMLMEGLGTSAGNFASMVFDRGLKGKLAGPALVGWFRAAFEAQMFMEKP